MISAKVNISKSLSSKLSPTWLNNCTSQFVDAVANRVLWNIQEYGFGSAKGNSPSGGSPIWQGMIWETGHYRGYLTESHQIKKLTPYHAQIVSSADFVEGVIEGFSTNWFDSDMNPITFPANYYHKRAVDRMYSEGTIPTICSNLIR